MRVPTRAQESARDLVRAREAARGDLMRARHRVSKLLLRHGIVYSGGKAWTAGTTRGCWVSIRSIGSAPRQPSRTTYEAVVWPPAVEAGWMRRSPRWPPPASSRRCAAAGLPARDLDLDRVRVGRRDRRVGPVHRWQHRRLPRPGPLRALLRLFPPPGRRSPRPATATSAGCWSRRRGTTASPLPSVGLLRRRWDAATPAARAVGTPATSGCTPAGSATAERKKRPVAANVAVARELAGWCWSLAMLPDS